jgi:hypothetical protein
MAEHRQPAVCPGVSFGRRQAAADDPVADTRFTTELPVEQGDVVPVPHQQGPSQETACRVGAANPSALYVPLGKRQRGGQRQGHGDDASRDVDLPSPGQECHGSEDQGGAEQDVAEPVDPFAERLSVVAAGEQQRENPHGRQRGDRDHRGARCRPVRRTWVHAERDGDSDQCGGGITAGEAANAGALSQRGPDVRRITGDRRRPKRCSAGRLSR